MNAEPKLTDFSPACWLKKLFCCRNRKQSWEKSFSPPAKNKTVVVHVLAGAVVRRLEHLDIKMEFLVDYFIAYSAFVVVVEKVSHGKEACRGDGVTETTSHDTAIKFVE